MPTQVRSDRALVAHLARRARRIAKEPLPPEVLRSAKAILLNDLTCAAIGTGAVVEKAEKFVDSCRQRSAPIRVLGTQLELFPTEAAFLGGVRIHAMALDSTHYASQAHLGAAIIPAALSAGQLHNATMTSVVSAIIAGWEIAALVGETYVDAVLARGLRASAAFGPLGSTTAVALLAGFDEAGIANAIALATNFGAGLSRTLIDGSDDWALQLGFAAEAGLRAVGLADAGYKGSQEVFEDDGLPGAWVGSTHEQKILARQLADDAAHTWRILSTEYKWYSSCNINQVPASLAAQLRTHDGFDLDDIVDVSCTLHPKDWAYPGIRNANPQSLAAALMSCAYCVASAFHYGTLLFDRFQKPHEDVAVARLARRIRVLADPTVSQLGARIEVRVKNGQRFVRALLRAQNTFQFSFDEVADICGERREMAGHPPNRHLKLVSAINSIANVPEVSTFVGSV